jgi:ABC-type multidrug transport system ATPase subunit
VRSLTKKFRDIVALKDINLRVDGGETLVIFGPNGAGKSTLLKTVAGLYRPTKGSVIVLGRDVHLNDSSLRKEISFLGENYALYDNLTVLDNLTFFSKLYGLNKSDYRPRIDELLKKFNASEYLNRSVGELSRGTKQKVAICRALLNDPKVLLLDEPTAFLDAKASESVHRELNSLERDGRTILYATQRLDEIYKIGNRMMLISKGRSLALGDINSALGMLKNVSVEMALAKPLNSEKLSVLKRKWEVEAHDRRNTLLFRVKSMSEIPELVKEVVKNGGRIISVTYLKPSLEEFLT